ncbi:MAG: hypothetical protein HS113_16120 [Verrucomicrobiales bacterium]|nr:hypothetical protein [Verrucomicrobiales bacterium]
MTETTSKFFYATGEAIPTGLPIVGLAVSPGDALAPARSGIRVIEASTLTGLKAIEGVFKIGKVIAEITLDIAENELDLFEKREQDGQSVKEALVELENKLGDEPIKRIEVFKEIQALGDLSEQYRAKVDEGVRLIDERAAFNKRVAAQTQRSRYQDMTFRVSRNHALQSYRADGGNHQAEPGLVLRFSTRVVAGQNFFGHPLSGGDHAFDPSQ